MQPDLPYGLSPKERTIVELITDGRTNKEIAAELNYAYPTIRMDVMKIFIKMDVANRVQAAVKWVREVENA